MTKRYTVFCKQCYSWDRHDVATLEEPKRRGLGESPQSKERRFAIPATANGRIA